MQLVHEGRVWAELKGWTDRRFDTDPGIRAVDRFPGSNTLSAAAPEGWSLVHERWPDLATRELIMRNMLGEAERSGYASLRRAQAAVPAGPHRGEGRRAQSAVGGRRGRHLPGRGLPAQRQRGTPLRAGRARPGRREGMVVSIAHRGECGVAMARRGPCGIDVEEVTERPRAPCETAPAGRSERTLLRAVTCGPADGADSGRSGSRGSGRPRRPSRSCAAPGCGAVRPTTASVAADTSDDRLVVRGRIDGPGRTSNPPGLPERRYVVAWTAADETGVRDDH